MCQVEIWNLIVFSKMKVGLRYFHLFISSFHRDRWLKGREVGMWAKWGSGVFFYLFQKER